MRVIDYRHGMSIRFLLKRHLKGIAGSATLERILNSAIFLAQRRYRPLSPANHPFFLKIEPTNYCDLSCPGCGTHHPREKGFMSMETFEAVIDALGRWCVRISLYGQGEPLLHPRIFEMVSMAERARCPVSISSNFNSLDGDRIEMLLESGLEHLIVCLDGATGETHRMFRRDSDFERIIESLGTLCRRRRARNLGRPVIEVQTIDFPFNHDEIGEISRIAADLGADLHSVRMDAMAPGAGRCLLGECPYPWGSLFISWDGRILPCENFCNPYARDQLAVTDLTSGADVWNSRWMVEARMIIRGETPDTAPPDHPCLNCHHYIS